MVKWKLLNDEEAREVWDQTLAGFNDCSPYQTYAWGEYQRALGWEACRWAAYDEEGRVIAMMQGLVRRYPLGLGLIWSEGGPVGNLAACDDSLHQALKQTTGLKMIYCRFRCDRGREVEDALRLSTLGWCRSWSPITTSYSMVMDLSQSAGSLLAACERDWRRNLRLAKKANLTTRLWMDPDPVEIMSVFLEMQNLKDLEEQHSLEEIEKLIKTYQDKLVLYRCDDDQGELVSLGGFVTAGARACNVLAATTVKGRKLHASYAIVWAQVEHCQKAGIASLDLAGIDPVVNYGVFRFKRGSGAAPIEYLGEWDWASHAWFRWLGNWAIARRSRIKQAEAKLKKSATRKKVAEPQRVPVSPVGQQRRRGGPDIELTSRPQLADARLSTAQEL